MKQASSNDVTEKYHEVFSEIFKETDFNRESFRYRDEGWDSIRQMVLITRLEDVFGISLEAKEAMNIKSYDSGFNIVQRKIEQKVG